MFPLFRILVFILKGLPLSVTNPFFWTVLLIIWLQYRKAADLEERMFGVVKISPGQKVLYAVLFGTLGGIAGSLVIVFLGISITEAGLIYVWPLAIMLMLIHPHLMCFSYAGGIVSLFSLIFGYPRVDVAGLMALVAVLHMVESLLIYTAGHLNSAPVFIQDKRYGIVGGFSLQEFWPVPIMLLAVVLGQAPTQDIINMPDWWPVIKPPPGILGRQDAVYLMIPVVAALGYGDVALTRTPRARSRASALNLLFFSVTLLLLSITASRIHAFKFVAALFAPAAHEALIILGRKNEREKQPLFAPSARGIRVLDVVKGSPAEKMGIEPGDIILSINGRQIEDVEDIRQIKAAFPTYVWVDVLKTDGSFKTLEVSAYPEGMSTLGVLLVPKSQDVPFVVMEEKGMLERLRKLFRKRTG
ncbi:PDZ domain-containing protein [Thermosediminibacter litoriperuensis]|uniref:PDZ domain-containing protein n=1 Tax=Thermosediminibacter litoriperuensis TaxID=291989 RepID=A0A5S5AX69_9FIRM|nr:PDZ domain-containing protein [Thermosediminibacter litoriperuensis]TYP57793.1 PDZ domain-containing protein [Thermosediminibacter litoriperuensis]